MNEHAQRLTTTLHLLHEENACESRYKHLVKSLGGVSFDHDTPINLLTILEHNGLEDCIWALRKLHLRAAGQQQKTAIELFRLIAADFAEAVLPAYESQYPEDRRPRESVMAARAYALGTIGAAARAAASDAAWAAASDAAGAAARDAASDAAWAAASDAAWAAAWADAWAAAKADQEKIVRSYLLPDCPDTV